MTRRFGLRGPFQLRECAQLKILRSFRLGQELGQDLEPRRPAKLANVGVDVKTVRILRENLHLVSERSVEVLPTWMILFHGTCIDLSKTTAAMKQATPHHSGHRAPGRVGWQVRALRKPLLACCAALRDALGR